MKSSLKKEKPETVVEEEQRWLDRFSGLVVERGGGVVGRSWIAGGGAGGRGGGGRGGGGVVARGKTEVVEPVDLTREEDTQVEKRRGSLDPNFYERLMGL